MTTKTTRASTAAKSDQPARKVRQAARRQDRKAATSPKAAASPVAGANAATTPGMTSDSGSGAERTPKGKLGALVSLLRRPEGAGIDELIGATGWQAHSVRGAISGAVKKKLGAGEFAGRRQWSGLSHLAAGRCVMSAIDTQATCDDATMQVRQLADMGLGELRDLWRRQIGPPPPLRSVDLLRLLLAWRIQVEAFGGLDRDDVRALRRATPAAPRQAALAAGTRISREWQGHAYSVEVVDGGFRYEGQTYRSLPQVARAITGVRWNGPRFFGLRQADAG